ncbi:DUF397 domain-containing protein [Streptomyces sp. SID12488]|nr:DUF397 domain-containing protein [Streptomyces sp. SID12488]
MRLQLVRDSKSPRGSVFVVPAAIWDMFVNSLKA